MRSFRVERVAGVVRSVVSNAIAHKLNDPRISPFSSVTRVEVTADLEHAKVHVSVMGDAGVQNRTMRGLESAAGVIQRLLAKELSTRHCPHLSFHLDESIKKAAETIRIINESMAEIESGSPAEGPPAQDMETNQPRGEGA